MIFGLTQKKVCHCLFSFEAMFLYVYLKCIECMNIKCLWCANSTTYLYALLALTPILPIFRLLPSNDLIVPVTQISKLSMIPVVCVMEWILHSKQYSKEVKMSVVVVVIGVGVCTVTDVKVNAKGFICACVAVVSTSLQQIVSISVIYLSFCISSLEFYPMLIITLISTEVD